MFATLTDLGPDITLVFMAAAFCALAYLAICARPGHSWLKTISKTLSVLLLAVIAFQTVGFLTLSVALVACAVGDFFLSREGDESFLSGVGAFAIGHLAYSVLFLMHPSADLHRISDGWPLVAALVLFGVAMMVLLFSKAGALRWAVMVYVPIIVLMGIMAMAMPFSGGLVLVLPAALLFIASDFVLSQELFVLSGEHKLRRYTPYVVWGLYWLAQALFLIAFLPAA
ncbi:lysoplasmalogenase [Lentibacter algarum]|uniref:lysoplasmalogenase n=1 Tax=Lentibacter algarum TaxID=576131 RepID=UPI001C08634E|nr:lysoplasmalogenase [Lentibacter algarum]MBU2983480.1 lysoplasmalogenase [Lentibacter algarum]